MPEAEHPFQYAILRVVPSLPRGEALNVGVILHCRQRDFLAMRTHLEPERLRALDPELDLDELARYLEGLQRVAEGDPGAGPMAALERSERFGWLVAPASGLVQPSDVHTGLSADPAATLDALAAELVERARKGC